MGGRVVHFEVPFDDGDRARGFYQKAFGWEIMPMPEMDYTIVSTGPGGEQGPSEPGFINGGMFARNEGFTTPNIVIDVESIDDALKTVTEAGGSVVRARSSVGDMGFTAYFKDTEGNLVGLWETVPRS